MTILVLLVDILCTYIEVYWMYQWINFCLEKKAFFVNMCGGGKNVEYFLKSLYIVIVFCMNRIALVSAYTMVVIMLITYATLIVFWKANPIQTSAVVGSYFLALFLYGNIVISATGLIGGEELILKTTRELGIIRLFYMIGNITIWYFVNHFCMAYLDRHNVRLQSYKSLAYVSIIGLIGSAFIGMMLVNSFTVKIGAIWYVFFFILLLVICGCYYVVKQKDAKAKMMILEAQNGMLERNYMQINESYSANAKLYHDMNHHLDALYRLLQDGNQEQAKKYLEKLRIPFDYTTIEVHTGISVVDAVIHEMNLKAREKGCVFEMEISMLPCDIGIENGDLCSLFANLLENAVDASVKRVYVQIKRINQTLLAVVKNDYTVKPVVKEGKFVSSKKDKLMHGWGTQIVDQIVQKYEGSIKYDIEESLFTVSVMLNEMIDD